MEGIKIAGVKPAMPQLPKTNAIWGIAVQGSTETLESSAEKAGFCTYPTSPLPDVEEIFDIETSRRDT